MRISDWSSDVCSSDLARELFRRTMWVLGTNVLSRGITDSAIACGAAVALAVGAFRVEAGDMELTALLVILMLGVEIFRPMRELRSVLHQGMVGMRSEEHTSELQSLMRISYAVFCL